MADATIGHISWLEKLEHRELGNWPKAAQRILVETRLDLGQSAPATLSGIRAVLCVLRDFKVAEREPNLAGTPALPLLLLLCFE